MVLIEQEDFVQLMAKCNNGYIEGIQDSISGEAVFLGDSTKVDHTNPIKLLKISKFKCQIFHK